MGLGELGIKIRRPRGPTGRLTQRIVFFSVVFLGTGAKGEAPPLSLASEGPATPHWAGIGAAQSSPGGGIMPQLSVQGHGGHVLPVGPGRNLYRKLTCQR